MQWKGRLQPGALTAAELCYLCTGLDPDPGDSTCSILRDTLPFAGWGIHGGHRRCPCTWDRLQLLRQVLAAQYPPAVLCCPSIYYRQKYFLGGSLIPIGHIFCAPCLLFSTGIWTASLITHKKFFHRHVRIHRTVKWTRRSYLWFCIESSFTKLPSCSGI